MEMLDMQIIFGVPYRFDIYEESNFKELMWAVKECLLGNNKRDLHIIYNGDVAECDIGDIAYGRSEDGSIQRSIVSALLSMLVDPSLEDNEDALAFKHIMSLIDWKH